VPPKRETAPPDPGNQVRNLTVSPWLARASSLCATEVQRKSKEAAGYAFLVATASQYQASSRVALTPRRVSHTQFPPQPHFPFRV